MSLLTGLHMNQLVEFLRQMNIASTSRTTFYRLQQNYVNKIIWQFWTEMRSGLLETYRHAGRALTVTGDGQVKKCKYVINKNCCSLLLVVEYGRKLINDK